MRPSTPNTRTQQEFEANQKRQLEKLKMLKDQLIQNGTLKTDQVSNNSLAFMEKKINENTFKNEAKVDDWNMTKEEAIIEDKLNEMFRDAYSNSTETREKINSARKQREKGKHYTLAELNKLHDPPDSWVQLSPPLKPSMRVEAALERLEKVMRGPKGIFGRPKLKDPDREIINKFSEKIKEAGGDTGKLLAINAEIYNKMMEIRGSKIDEAKSNGASLKDAQNQVDKDIKYSKWKYEPLAAVRDAPPKAPLLIAPSPATSSAARAPLNKPPAPSTAPPPARKIKE